MTDKPMAIHGRAQCSFEVIIILPREKYKSISFCPTESLSFKLLKPILCDRDTTLLVISAGKKERTSGASTRKIVSRFNEVV